MAVQSTIKLHDGMSAALKSMNKALSMVLDSFEEMQVLSGQAVNTGAIEEARAELARTETLLNEINDEIKKIPDGVDEAGDGFTVMKGIIADIAADAISAIGQGIKQSISDAINYASDLTEVQNVVDVTFGNSAGVVDEWAKTTLNAYGLSELSAKRFSGTMGAMLKSSGMTGDAVMEMSQRLTELSGDMASFYNLSGEEAFEKIRSGISGETEPLKQLGINMSVANLEAYALSQGIKTAYNEMSQAEQVALRYGYLMSVTADAQGDFARTSDSFANQQKLMKEQWLDFTGMLAAEVLPTLTAAIKAVNSSIEFLKNNWSIIGPLMTGLLTIFGLYITALLSYTIATKAAALATTIKAFADKVHAASLAMSTGATFAATAAQYGFNAALLACPLTWILLIIIAVIAVIYAVVAAINKAQGTTISATGVIMGVLAVAAAFIWNLIVGLINAILELIWAQVEPFIGIIEWILNVCNGGFNSFGDAVANLIGNIIGWFLSLGKVVTKIIDAIFGTKWSAGLESLKADVTSWGKNEKAITIERSAPELQRIEYGDAWEVGYNLGDKFAASSAADEAALAANYGGATEYDTLGDDVGTIADNTSNIDKTLSDADLSLLRDVAAMEWKANYTTREVVVNLGGVSNVVNEKSDLDGIVTYLSAALKQDLETSAVGVHL